MLVDQRRGNILEIVESKGFVSLQELVDAVGASESTVRRDLDHLDGTGQIRRTRGGAAYVGDSLTAFDDRQGTAVVEKQRIGRRAAELIEPGETVLLDGGTTTLEVARNLVGKRLQVVTNSLPIVNLLVGAAEVELVYLGGYVYPKTGVALGALTIEALKGIRARRLVMSVGGITEAGLFNSNSLLVETERQMIEAADEVIVVTDSGKLGHTELAHLCPLGDVQKMVVDGEITEEWRATLEESGVDVVIAE
ncbi:MAG: DeoR/GlpR transcriptional regulator [Planctomycetota bacterium]|nr:MAG: DeoR/GlpR transcriptional regulator [Planctomycetota bacterium]REJ93817.1 MAG: DeoR/GlpR transcriptional regulator [Planctomycetota bacterium]REK21153.1 MAG: DeoR/GlpR transcriptional regulator [Planctomycetota bacterium]REK29561.1 MAG: DeoR/GlpR transcriptional regulator [Planctomycetota bacterium]